MNVSGAFSVADSGGLRQSEGLKATLLSCALWLMRCWTEVSAVTRVFPVERSAGWDQVCHPAERPRSTERESRAWAPEVRWPGRAEAAAGPMCMLWLSPTLEAVDLASHKHRP